MKRCAWVSDDPLYIEYHDSEWGREQRDGLKLFEMLCLEGAQAGLSWITVLKKRQRYREVFDAFDPQKMACYDDAKRQQLLADPGIIRNKLKVNAFIVNAQKFLEFESADAFSDWLWAFAGGQPKINSATSLADVATVTAEAEAMSKALKKAGFKFVGPTICYAFMQASGMVVDHTTDCHCYGKPAVQ